MLELPLMPRRPHIACLPSSPSLFPSNHRSRHPVSPFCIESYYFRYTIHSPILSNLQMTVESRGPKATYEKGIWPDIIGFVDRRTSIDVMESTAKMQ